MLDPISLGHDRSKLVKLLKGTCSVPACTVPALCNSAESPLSEIFIGMGIRFFTALLPGQDAAAVCAV